MNIKLEIAGLLGLSPSTVARALAAGENVSREVRKKVRALEKTLRAAGKGHKKPLYPTQREIAKKAGVSVQAVSKALSGSSEISEKTRSKVTALASSLGYRKNAAAAAMKKMKTHSLGLVILREYLDYGESWVSSALGVMSRVGAGRGYRNIILYPFSEKEYDQYNEINYASMLRDGRVDGGLIFVSRSLTQDHIKRLEKENVPCILINDHLNGSRLSYYSIEQSKGVQNAVEALYARGRRAIAYIGHLGEDMETYARFTGYQKAVRVLGLPELPVHVPYYNTVESVTTEFIKKNPSIDAIVVFSCKSAIPVYRALHNLHREIPRDVAVIGYDDHIFSPYLVPSLSGISFITETIVEQATNDLIDLIEGKTKRSIQKSFVPQLVLRESV